MNEWEQQTFATREQAIGVCAEVFRSLRRSGGSILDLPMGDPDGLMQSMSLCIRELLSVARPNEVDFLGRIGGEPLLRQLRLLEQCRNDLEGEQAAMEQRLRTLTEEQAALEKTREQLRIRSAEAAAARKECEALRQEVAALTSALSADPAPALSELRREQQALSARLEEARRQVHSEQETRDRLEQALRAMQDEEAALAAIRAETEAVTDRRETLRRQTDSARSALDALRQQYETLDCPEYRRQLRILTGQREALETVTDNLLRELDTDGIHSEDLRRSPEDIRAALEKKQKAAEAACDDFRETLREILRLLEHP